jgi:hypothetical protein
MPLKIAILEDNRDRQAAMLDRLADRFHQYEIRLFDGSDAMIAFLEESLADTLVVSLDHDLDLKEGTEGQMLDPGTGREVADYLARQTPACPVVIHTSNSVAASGMETVLQAAGWTTHRVVPFDDLQWIETEWFRTMRRAIVDQASPAPYPRQ